jgi:hypothetical protein
MTVSCIIIPSATALASPTCPFISLASCLCFSSPLFLPSSHLSQHFHRRACHSASTITPAMAHLYRRASCACGFLEHSSPFFHFIFTPAFTVAPHVRAVSWNTCLPFLLSFLFPSALLSCLVRVRFLGTLIPFLCLFFSFPTRLYCCALHAFGFLEQSTSLFLFSPCLPLFRCRLKLLVCAPLLS